MSVYITLVPGYLSVFSVGGLSDKLMLGNYSWNDGKRNRGSSHNTTSLSDNFYRSRSQSRSASLAASYLDSIPESGSEREGENAAVLRHNNNFPNSIGEYGMGKLLGRGAFGSVYEVTEIRHETPLNDFRYAIKIVRG